MLPIRRTVTRLRGTGSQNISFRSVEQMSTAQGSYSELGRDIALKGTLERWRLCARRNLSPTSSLSFDIREQKIADCSEELGHMSKLCKKGQRQRRGSKLAV